MLQKDLSVYREEKYEGLHKDKSIDNSVFILLLNPRHQSNTFFKKLPSVGDSFF